MKRIGRTALLLLQVTLLVCLTSCNDDDGVLGTIADEESDLFTWIWAVGSDDSIRVHDADTGELHAVFFANGHPLMRQVAAGPDDEPTVWLGSGGRAYGFTAGFHAHEDHAHMEIPERLGPVATGGGNTHQGVSSDGARVIYANDDDETFTVIDTATLAARTLHHGSGHSAAMLAGDRLIATQMDPGRVRLVDAAADTVIVELTIATGAHGDALLHSGAGDDIAFIATGGGFEVLDVATGVLETPIPYAGDGRVNFLYHGGDNTVAFGPRHLDAGDADDIVLLDMEHRAVESLTIPGAALAWNIGGGNFALSGDGGVVAATDLSAAKAYIACIDADAACYGTVLEMDAPAADMACAVNHFGDHLWLLDKNTGMVFCYHPDEGELHNSWQLSALTEYIFVTCATVDVIKDF